ncbi:retrovirus-related pol polyprotein from transposon TNT 1-94 [Tanacetum coccineum]|uniref:Retrovirus-related pol polyprotein from transposon TNT 1-94 n=1 Tax=Tanacetum coccineum TaxID=301880 RepID=A0ABQ4XJ57_9ASTR
MNKRRNVINNKARLVAQGYTHEEGVDYDEVFALVAKIEEIRLFLAYASFKDFVVYQMDIKSAFLYGKIKENVYVCQPPRFEDPYFPERVYKVEKVLYGLHQAPRAWYETLSTYSLDNGFQRGKIDKTLSIRRDKGDILLVQIQDKYVAKILKKFGFIEVKTASTPMETQKLLLKDEDGKEVDVYLYRSIIGSLMYLTSSRPDVMFIVCACARYQVNPKVSHLHAVKRIFSDYAGASLDRKSTTGEAEYLLQVAVAKCFGFKINCLIMGLDYGKRDLQLDYDEGMDCLSNATIFEELTRIRYEKLSQKLTFYKAFFSPHWKNPYSLCVGNGLSAKTTAWNEFSSIMASAIICLATNQKFNFSKYIFENMVKNLENVSGKFLMYPRLRFIQVFLDNQLEGMSSHKRIYVTPSHTKKIFANMRRQGKDFSGRVTSLFPTMVVQAQEEMGEGSAMPTDPNTHPSLLNLHHLNLKGNKNLGGLRRRTLKYLSLVFLEITSLKLRVKRLEKKGGSRTQKLKRLYKIGRSARVVSSDEASLGDQEDASNQGRKINDIDVDAEITLVDETQGRHDDDLMFDTSVLNDEEVFARQDMAEKEVSTADLVTTAGELVTTIDVAISTVSTILVSVAATITENEIILAQALPELKSVEPKVTTATTTATKGILLQKPSESRTTTTTIPSKDKGKGIMVEEPLKMKKKDQISFDEQEAIRLQAKLDEEVRLAKEKDEANVALIEEWNDIQAKIETDYELAQRLQAEEQEEMEAQRLKEQVLCLIFQDLFGQSYERVKTLGHQNLVEGDELEQEKAKKQKVDEDKEITKLQSLMEVIPYEEEVVVDATPLATKPPSIVDWKILKEEKISYYQIIRADEGEILQAFSLKNTFPKCSTLNTVINKAGTKLLLHSAHFSCSWDYFGDITLKASAAEHD